MDQIPVLLRIIVAEDDIQKICLKKKPDSLEELVVQLKDLLSLPYDFKLQYEDLLPSTLQFHRHCRLAWESYIENHPSCDSFVNNLAITHHTIRQWGQPRWHWWQHGRHGDLVNCRITAVGKKTTMMTMDVRMLPSMAVVQDMVERWPALSGRYRSVLCPNATCNLW